MVKETKSSGAEKDKREIKDSAKREALLLIARQQALAAQKIREEEVRKPPNVILIPDKLAKDREKKGVYGALGDAYVEFMQLLGVDIAETDKPPSIDDITRSDKPISKNQMRTIEVATVNKQVVGSWSSQISNERSRGERGMPIGPPMSLN